ncbi:MULTISPECIES: serine/threonine protein kinase [unclassified Coleofasciculus]|uniref:serine/threonine protein kinase n=1 Tax=unclassified Coleofasciculus TaxID=2692782 RepID=UPI00188093E4|nr:MULTISPECIES: serine/threonine-protein kinase [unclassified Coleofasciculus]MBE9130002.1 serine/threonine protein kinase [Coleofasciculus sp. LEGE 07081]MBE9151560.1 serine/threonine protein kinase [Coleofasciculus sp. LEGE 07092]
MSNFPNLSSHGFRVVKELGHNRTGGRVTYLAVPLPPLTQKGTVKQAVVIKQFQFARSDANWSDYDAIEQEIKVLRGLNHPGIPRYLGSFQTATGFCLVQEYKNAPSLAVPRSFDPDEIKQLAVSLLNILVYLQNRIPAVSHRDIKPENVLVDDDINVYLVDFGLARIGDSEMTISSVAKGTVGFMAPEQLFNRQISEASDLYGLGATLVCLLTGTPSIAISQLIDEDYRLNFKHLVPKLSIRWIEWLEKMVELKPKDRFPDAETALEALNPIYVIRVPEVKFSQPCLDVNAKRLGEKVIQKITISNAVSDTLLESRWEVASHVSDPPHTPDFHDWIQFEQAHFISNEALCKITVDTSKLMVSKTYEREILIHTNSQPETQRLKINVHTAPVPIPVKKLPYFSLSLLVLFATAATWVETMAWEKIVSNSGTVGVAIAIFVSALVAALGLVAAITSGLISKGMAKIRTRFGVRIKAFDTVASVFFAGIAAILVAKFGAQFRVSDAAITAFAAVDAVVFMAAFESEGVAESCRQRGFSKALAFGVSFLSAALGISLGIGLKLGFVNGIVLSGILGTSVPLATLILYPPLDRARRIANYRKLEGNLIKP